MTPRIERAINVFLKALEEGTLAKGTCTACAVGNLVAAGYNKPITNINGTYKCPVSNNQWAAHFVTVSGKQRQSDNFNELVGLDNISKTEFTKNELAKIEFTFETNTEISFVHYCNYTKEEIRADQLKGLEAVIQVMLDFDDCKDIVKEIFTSKADLIPVC